MRNNWIDNNKWNTKNEQERLQQMRRARARVEAKRLEKLFQTPSCFEDDEYTLDVWELMNQVESGFRW